MKVNNPEISVIIPTLNEEKYIPLVLEGLKKQTFKSFETIVVDGGSEDRTREIARKCATVLIERKNGVGCARNLGAAHAKGRILVFIDADTKPSANLLATYAKVLNGNDIVASTGPIMPLEKAARKK